MQEWDILPSRRENDEFVEEGTLFVMRFLTDTFPGLAKLSFFCPASFPYMTPSKPDVTPLEILDENEGTKDGNIRVLKQFAVDVSKTDAEPVVKL